MEQSSLSNEAELSRNTEALQGHLDEESPSAGFTPTSPNVGNDQAPFVSGTHAALQTSSEDYLSNIVPEDSTQFVADAHCVINPAATEGAATLSSAELDPAKWDQVLQRLKRFRLSGLIALAVTVVVVAIAIVVAVKANNNQNQDKATDHSGSQQADRGLFIRQAVQAITPIPAFIDPSSAQSKAMNWMVYTDQTPLHRETILQRYALLVFFYSTNGPNWNNVKLWTSNPDAMECLWSGIICNSSRTQDNLVTNIELSMANAAGTLPSELAVLSMLELLDLSNNRLTGSIPTAIFELTQLEVLRLSLNEFSSKISTHLGQLSLLQVLALNSNYLTGSIPPSISNLTNLRALTLSFNKLIGPIFLYVMNMVQMTDLSIGETELTGSIPTELAALSNLRRFDTLYSHFEATIPTELGNLKKLEKLVLASDKYFGTIPTEFGNFRQLDYLFLSGFGLTGTFPTSIGHLTNLVNLDWSRTRVGGTIPTEFGYLHKLTDLNLGVNELKGAFPSQLVHLTHLESLTVVNNNLTGTIPDALCQAARRTYFYIDCPPAINCSCCECG